MHLIPFCYNLIYISHFLTDGLAQTLFYVETTSTSVFLQFSFRRSDIDWIFPPHIKLHFFQQFFFSKGFQLFKENYKSLPNCHNWRSKLVEYRFLYNTAFPQRQLARAEQQPVQAGCIFPISLHVDRCHLLFSPLYEFAKCFR